MGYHLEGHGQVEELGSWDSHEVQQDQEQGATHGSGQPPVPTQAVR